MGTTFPLLSLRTAVWFPPGCLAPCLSRDSYTNLFQKSPLWWEIQTLRKKPNNKGKKREDTLVNTEVVQIISVQIRGSVVVRRTTSIVFGAGSLYTYAAIALRQLGGVASHGRQLALQTFYFIGQV